MFELSSRVGRSSTLLILVEGGDVGKEGIVLLTYPPQVSTAALDGGIPYSSACWRRQIPAGWGPRY